MNRLYNWIELFDNWSWHKGSEAIDRSGKCPGSFFLCQPRTATNLRSYAQMKTSIRYTSVHARTQLHTRCCRQHASKYSIQWHIRMWNFASIKPLSSSKHPYNCTHKHTFRDSGIHANPTTSRACQNDLNRSHYEADRHPLELANLFAPGLSGTLPREYCMSEQPPGLELMSCGSARMLNDENIVAKWISMNQQWNARNQTRQIHWFCPPKHVGMLAAAAAGPPARSVAGFLTKCCKLRS